MNNRICKWKVLAVRNAFDFSFKFNHLWKHLKMYYVNVALWGALHLLKAKLSNLALFQRQETLCAVHVSLCTQVMILC